MVLWDRIIQRGDMRDIRAVGKTLPKMKSGKKGRGNVRVEEGKNKYPWRSPSGTFRWVAVLMAKERGAEPAQGDLHREHDTVLLAHAVCRGTLLRCGSDSTWPNNTSRGFEAIACKSGPVSIGDMVRLMSTVTWANMYGVKTKPSGRHIIGDQCSISTSSAARHSRLYILLPNMLSSTMSAPKHSRQHLNPPAGTRCGLVVQNKEAQFEPCPASRILI